MVVLLVKKVRLPTGKSLLGGLRRSFFTISVIDIAAQKELRRVNIGPFSRPHGITSG